MNADTLAVRQTGEQTLHKKTAPFNVKRIIESLPENATPSQQDSAVQANLPQRPSFRSTQPDTLNLPGWNIPKSKKMFFRTFYLINLKKPIPSRNRLSQSSRYRDWDYIP